ncbi:MAG: transporter substrate-binding protein, partial [Geminicoccaceae bacterium]|nr:transporter substrate-binding protein [Geminicoccaceae bacterium]
MSRIHQLAAVLALGGLVQASASGAADELTVGMITTLSGPGAGLGIDIRDGFALAVEHLDGKFGDFDAKVIEADDQQKPDVAVQLAERMLSRDGAEIVTGTIWSNLALAMLPAVARAEKVYISPNAGPSQLAGAECNRNFFNTAFQNDAVHEATGKVVAAAGIKRVWLLAPNYPAGQDALRGFRRAYDPSGGEVVDEVYTQLGQLDYAAEIAAIQAARPEAVYFFYPGGMGIAFLKQWAQAGVGDQVKLYASAFSVSQDILPAVGAAALGVENAAHWSPDLEAGINQRFVEDFTAKYGRLPSLFAAQGYDTALFIDAAAQAAGSTATDALIESLEQASIQGTRGTLRLNTNHFPIQNFYLREVVKD